MNLQSANIPPEVANAVIGLFSDPISVTKLQEQYMKQKTELQNQLNKVKNTDVQEQNNDIKNVTQLQEQEQ